MSVEIITPQNLQNIYDLSDDQINNYCGLAYGWVDYPTDSIECGRVWHLDKDTAPFGRVMKKRYWKPLDSDAIAFRLMIDYGLVVRVLSSRDQTLIQVVGETTIMQKVDGDVYKATRRAIALAVVHLYLSKNGCG